MGKLSNIARNISGLGGTYISLNDLIAEYPEGVTVNGAFITDNQQKACLICTEAPDKYFYAEAGDLKKIFAGWLNACNGSIDELNETLNGENVKLKIFKKNIGGGKTYTKACVVTETEFVAAEIDTETGEILTETAPF